jgi:putative ABC transport system ATP-binding protein
MLKLSNVTKSFSGCFEPVLNSINLELQNGDFCVLIGSNGSGKSTLISSITGQYQIDSGNIIIDAKDMTNKDRSHLIATVIQDVNKATIPEMTLLENMVLSKMRGQKVKFSFYQSFESEIFTLVKELGIGLEAYINKPIGSLSGGQRQMIATLMAIYSKPQILFLDEHTSALDPQSQNMLMRYSAHAIKQHNITTLMVTHKLEDAIKYGNRLIMLHKGRIVFEACDAKKSALKVSELLTVFHKYEDLEITYRGVQNDN